MDVRRALWGASVKLAIVMSTIAAVLTATLDAVADVSPVAMASTVAGVGFATSWALASRVTRTATVRSHHRVSTVRLRHPVG